MPTPHPARAALAAILLAGGGAQAEGVINLLNYADYMSQDQLDRFEAETGIRVITTPIDSNETLLARLQAGAGGFDAAVATDYMVQTLRDQGFLAPVDPKDLPNWVHVDPALLAPYYDPENLYAVPYQRGTTSIMVDTAVIPDPASSLSLLFDPPEEARGRINVHRDMHDVINAALRYLGHPRCNADPEQMREVNDLLQRAKPYWRSINADGSRELLVSGDVVVSQIWAGLGMRARAEKPTLRYIYTDEGFTGWVDSLVALEGAENLEEVEVFMNWLLDPANAAELTNHAGFSAGVTGVEPFLSAELLASPESVAPEGTPAPEFVPPCPPEVIALYDRIWTNLLR
jgi:spermidine/putrescine transport system substrate-binding protein